jgi:DNA-binding transcriptional LysR family regulator
MSQTPSWDHYRTFLTVLREGSLSAAARALGLTQPTVGRHIDSLEKALDRELFVRSPGGLAPTEAATELRPQAEVLEAAAASLLRSATTRGTVVRGTVRVAASEVIGVEVLPPILTALRQRHPLLAVELVLSDSVADLMRRDADIAIRMVEPEQKALIARRIGTIKVGLFAHRHYLDRVGMPGSMAALAGHALIGFDRETAAIRSMQQRVPEMRRALFSLRCDSDVAQLAMIRAGFGIGACQLALAARDGHLIRVLGSAFRLDLPTAVVMHEDLRGNRSCRAVFDALVNGLQAYLREQERGRRVRTAA